jgi:hypothetical protein
MSKPVYTPIPPVQIDVPGGGAFAAQYSSGQQGPIVYGNFLYSVLTTDTTCEILRSSDRGASWEVQDSSNQPTDANLSSVTACFDGSSIIVAYTLAGSSNAPVKLKKFDCNTNTWSAVFATSAQNVSIVFCVYLRSDGSYVIFNGVTAVAGNSGLNAAIYKSGVWTEGIDVGHGMLAVSGYDTSVAATSPTFCTDQNSVFCFWFTFWPDGTRACFFQQFTLANALGNFFTFPGMIGFAIPDLQSPQGSPIGVPCIANNQLIVPVARNIPAFLPSQLNYATLYTSVDSGATWVEMISPLGGIDPDVEASTVKFFDNLQFPPMATWDGQNLYVIYARITPLSVATFGGSTELRLCVTTPNGTDPSQWTWSCSTVASLSRAQILNGLSFSFPKVSILTQPSQNVLVSTDINNVNTFSLNAWWYGNFFGPLTMIAVPPNSLMVITLPFCFEEECRIFV